MGSTRNLQDPMTPVRELVIVPGSFQTNGTSAPLSVLGDGFTVARASAGTFTVTLDKTYPKVLSVQATLQSATGGALRVAVDDLGTTAESAFTLRLEAAAGTATDLAAGANNRVQFVAYCKRTKVS